MKVRHSTLSSKRLFATHELFGMEGVCGRFGGVAIPDDGGANKEDLSSLIL